MREKRPNVVLILADDLGFSDIGCYGGEIETPNLDALKKEGVYFSQFYNTARCCPTRASLLTGLHPHQTGIGHMTHTPTDPKSHDHNIFGYRGFLNRNCVTMAEVLKESGYHTYMSGKWHLGEHEKSQWPTERGFERFYGIHAGACNYFKPGQNNGLYLQDEPIAPAENYYSTDEFTNYATRFIKEQSDDAPFFLYLAYNAPHWPLQAPAHLVEKYKGKYLSGFDEIRKKRYEKQIRLGIIERENCALSKSDAEIPQWELLTKEQQVEMDYRMATYAAQVDSMDQNIGRLCAFLRKENLFDNTIVMFLSDNGGCAEGGVLGGNDISCVNAVDLPGLCVSYGQGWANVSNTPFRLYKRFVNEGGIATPLLICDPKGIQKDLCIKQPAYLPDILPTVLELTGGVYPEYAHGNPMPKLEGRSLCGLLQGETNFSERMMYWEHEDSCSVRKGKYKAVQRYNTRQWELYDLSLDRSETNNIATWHPDLISEFDQSWQQWAETHHVSPKWKM